MNSTNRMEDRLIVTSTIPDEETRLIPVDTTPSPASIFNRFLGRMFSWVRPEQPARNTKEQHFYGLWKSIRAVGKMPIDCVSLVYSFLPKEKLGNIYLENCVLPLGDRGVRARLINESQIDLWKPVIACMKEFAQNHPTNRNLLEGHIDSWEGDLGEATTDEKATLLFNTLRNFIPSVNKNELDRDEKKIFLNELKNLNDFFVELTKVSGLETREEIKTVIEMVVESLCKFTKIKEQGSLTSGHICEIDTHVKKLLEKSLPKLAMHFSDPRNSPLELSVHVVEAYCKAIKKCIGECGNQVDVEQIFANINEIGRSVIASSDYNTLRSLHHELPGIVNDKIFKENPRWLRGPEGGTVEGRVQRIFNLNKLNLFDKISLGVGLLLSLSLVSFLLGALLHQEWIELVSASYPILIMIMIILLIGVSVILCQKANIMHTKLVTNWRQ